MKQRTRRHRYTRLSAEVKRRRQIRTMAALMEQSNQLFADMEWGILNSHWRPRSIGALYS